MYISIAYNTLTEYRQISFLKFFTPCPNLHCSRCIFSKFSPRCILQFSSTMFEPTVTYKTSFLFQWMTFLYLKRKKTYTKFNIEFGVISIPAFKIWHHLNDNTGQQTKFWKRCRGTTHPFFFVNLTALNLKMSLLFLR